ncbi:MAG TPA: hypothetical protein VK094_05715 [Pseudogracilibacillus sp.]|nr:hypothetical protein [Pseudogracilibacillus sp.]
MSVMKSVVYCSDCNKKTIHFKRDAGPWSYQVCERCEKETLLWDGAQDNVWKEFNKNRIDDLKGRSGLF